MNHELSFQKLTEEKRVLICCGSGGVGKTTTAAAIALSASSRGLKTLVLTIDPAKRLANALGIKNIDYREKMLPRETLKKSGITPNAPLYAMMLDTKRTFDAIILKYASSPEQAEAILSNKLYHHLSNMIAGSQEYMAMEKLYEISQERDYDLIVLDTPPSRHALDFLDAPKKMSALVGDSVMKWFLKPSLFVSRAGLSVLDRSMKRVFRSFDKVAGFEFLQDLSAMLVTTSGLLAGFQERADKVQALLHDRQTSFILIASPQPIPLQEADYFFKKINEYSLPFSGFIFNRVQFIPGDGEKPPNGLTKKTRERYAEVERLFKSLSERDQRQLKKFQKKTGLEGANYFFRVLPQLEHDVHDLASLKDLGERLFSPVTTPIGR
jgi:anion-transporting  ArsA/GET3 family ATPase